MGLLSYGVVPWRVLWQGLVGGGEVLDWFMCGGREEGRDGAVEGKKAVKSRE